MVCTLANIFEDASIVFERSGAMVTWMDITRYEEMASYYSKMLTDVTSRRFLGGRHGQCV